MAKLNEPALTEGLAPAEQAELGELGGVRERLSRYVAPLPSAADTEALLATLRPLVAARGVGTPVAGGAVVGTAAAPDATVAADAGLFWAPEPSPTGIAHWLKLAKSQTSLMDGPFWLSSLMILALGLLLGVTRADHSYSLLFALSSPVLAAVGVAYAFRPSVRSLWEIEKVCPISPFELLYARIGVVMAANLGVAVILLGLVWATDPRLVLWRLIAAWFGPMLALAGVALYVTVRWGAIAGAAAPLTLWVALLTTVANTYVSTAPEQTWISALTAALTTLLTTSNAALFGSGVAVAVGLTLLHRAGRIAVGDDVAWN